MADVAHHETAYQFDMLMHSLKPEIAERIRKKRVLCLLISHNERPPNCHSLPRLKSARNWTSTTGADAVFHAHRHAFDHVFAGEVMEYEGGMRLESIWCMNSVM